MQISAYRSCSSGNNPYGTGNKESVFETISRLFLSYRLPMMEWLCVYDLDIFFSDLNAGATVFVLLIPQAMAYAVLANVPPVYGLYSSTAALFVYTVFGYSRQLAIGPMAITSLLSGAAVRNIGYDPDTDEDKFIAASLSMALYTGIILVVMGLFQLGFVTNFLSSSVLSGFVTGSAGIIALSQLKYVIGLPIERKEYSHQIIYEICSNLDKIHIYGKSTAALVLFLLVIWQCLDCGLTRVVYMSWCGMPTGLVVGVVTTFLLYLNKRWRQNFKAEAAARISSGTPMPLTEWQRIEVKYLYPLSNVTSLVAVVITTFVSFMIHKNSSFTFPIVGKLPQGLKTPSWPSMHPEVIPGAVMIGLISFAGTVVKRRGGGRAPTHAPTHLHICLHTHVSLLCVPCSPTPCCLIGQGLDHCLVALHTLTLCLPSLT